MEPITLPLEPTKSRSCRELHWQPAPKESKVLWGVLTIIESSGPRTKTYCSRYLVAELPTGRANRVFKFTKPGGTDTHYVEFRTNEIPEYKACQCEGFLAGYKCKHISSLEALEKAGQLNQQQPVEPEGTVV